MVNDYSLMVETDKVETARDLIDLIYLWKHKINVEPRFIVNRDRLDDITKMRDVDGNHILQLSKKNQNLLLFGYPVTIDDKASDQIKFGIEENASLSTSHNRRK